LTERDDKQRLIEGPGNENDVENEETKALIDLETYEESKTPILVKAGTKSPFEFLTPTRAMKKKQVLGKNIFGTDKRLVNELESGMNYKLMV
jgi:hypothetical protein